MNRFLSAIVTSAALLGASIASAGTVLVSGSPLSSFAVDGSSKTAFRGILEADNTLVFAADMSDAAQVASADALYVETRGTTSQLSAAELANIAAFISTGKRVYLGGENTSWTTWNNSILSLVGSSAGASVTGFQTTTLMHPLTAGVAQVNVPAGSGPATGGTSLFSGNFANLWGADQNVLTLQDTNMFQNAFIGEQDNTQFARNVSAWLADGDVTTAPVPVPAALPFLLTGLAGLGLMARRRKMSA
ncbi:VPLPA-CTERM sorting domain-containing protein [Primorskyibacter sp. S187A]|uniref:VPLPA-CTERM sorting domain-containing protein n=1 Tax=Primorskyibacter sp. S187A TaxID=3415130 RepID=UPI003C7E76ED